MSAPTFAPDERPPAPALPSVLDEPEVAAKRRSPLLEALNTLDARHAHEAGIEAVADAVKITWVGTPEEIAAFQAKHLDALATDVSRKNAAVEDPVQIQVSEGADLPKTVRVTGLFGNYDAPVRYETRENGAVVGYIEHMGRKRQIIFNPPPASGSTQEDESMASTNETPGFVGSMANGQADFIIGKGRAGGGGYTTAAGIPQGRLVGAERGDANALPPNTLDGAINRLQSSLSDVLALAEYIERMAMELNPDKCDAKQAEPFPPRPSGLLPGLSYDLTLLAERLRRAQMAACDVSRSLGVD
jgi:hypothetical protein